MGLLKFSRGTNARSLRECRLREARYFQHLARSRFSPKDTPYVVFAHDPFHDGEVLIRSIRLFAGVTTFSFRNVYAVDAVDRARRAAGLPNIRFDRENFRTVVRFRGVHKFAITGTFEGTRFYYNSNIFRESAGYRMAIQIWGRRDFGAVEIAFESVDVEDISGKIAQYLPDGTEPAAVLGYTTRPPNYYGRILRRGETGT